MVAMTRSSDIYPAAEVLRAVEGEKALAAALCRVELPEETLKYPEIIILHRDSIRFFECVARKLGMPEIGVEAALLGGSESLGLWGNYVSQGRTLREALERMVQTVRYNENFSEAWIDYGKEFATINYRGSDRSTVGWDKLADYIVTLLIDLVRHFAGPNWVPRWINVDYKKPSNRRPLDSIVEAPTYFGADAISLTISNEELALPNAVKVAAREIITLADLNEEAFSIIPSDKLTLAKFIINQRLQFQKVELDGLAKDLGWSRRSLQRLFESENTCYRDLLNSSRKSRAVAFLQETDLGIDDISLLLGYSTSSHFTRAFRDWTGTTPTDYKRRLS